MQVLSWYKLVERNTPPSQQEMSRMGSHRRTVSSGWLVDTKAACQASRRARAAGPGRRPRVTVLHEPKELVGGFAILRTNSRRSYPTGQQFLQVVGEGDEASQLRRGRGKLRHKAAPA